jgi:hypothetical protein
MKKYFPGLIAIVCALTFSAFTQPFTQLEFKLRHDPISTGIVAINLATSNAEWTTSNISGQYYGDCAGPVPDLACTILLDDSRSSYYHTDFTSQVVLNTFLYANAQSPKKDYLEITESTGLGSDRTISVIHPKHYNSGTQQYEDGDLLGNLSFVNAQEVEE